VSDAPLPPVELANRVGRLIDDDGSYAVYETVGAQLRSVVDQALPDDWRWPGKRVLDFGAGSGRTLRHFLREARQARFEGCDIDAAAIEWLNTNLNPPVTGFVNAEAPPLARPTDTYDVVYAFSVFTHITDRWADWLLELHRVLRPGGWLIASFLGEGMSRTIAGEPWDPRRIGMNVLHAHQDWDAGGPSVLMSPWWLREHWGRAFDIVSLDEGATEGTHGLVVARPRPGSFTAEDLRRIDPSDQREINALQHNLAQVQREAATAAEQHVRTIQGFEQSRSWRVTAPLRWRPHRRN
jgi:SAM-dependent methyltransferase